MESSAPAPRVCVHYGIPSTASILAFDPIQRLLAIGTLDGRIKVIGGDNIEGLLVSPKALPFKNLEFLQNQGFLVSVSNENEIQVWDLRKRCISSNIQWESNITAFSVIPSTHFIYVGDEYGFLSVLKYDAEEGIIIQLPYHIPPNLVAEGSGVSLPDDLSIVGVLSQPHSYGNRVLIAYENGLIILWDVTEDRVVHVRYHNRSLEKDHAEKDISSLCWVSPDGSALAVGYVDGDILLWNLSVPDNSKSQRSQNMSNDVVKIQLSSRDKRLPVIVLHWSSNRAQGNCGGQLFAYGGEDIGSEEVLTILNLEWSAGLIQLKCVERVDLTLHGSFADVIITPKAHEPDNYSSTSIFILTNPGQLLFYDFTSLSIFKPGSGRNVHGVQYHPVIPTVEPHMTVGRLCLIGLDRSFLSEISEFSPAKLQADGVLTGRGSQWPLTGGVPCQPSPAANKLQRMYIGGYQDGSVRIWDATPTILSLVSVLRLKIEGIQVSGSTSAVSALDFSSITLTLAVGNESGAVFIYILQGNSSQPILTLITETSRNDHDLPHAETNHCSAIFSVLNSPVRALQFVNSGVRLLVGYECGQVAILDTSLLSVLSITDCLTSSRSPIISVAVKSFLDTHENNINNSENDIVCESITELAFVLTKDAQTILIDSDRGNIHVDPENQPLQSSHENLTGLSSAEGHMQHTCLGDKTLETQILLCCNDAVYTYPLRSLFQGNSNFVRLLNLEKPCSWTTILKRNEEEYGLIVVYQTGEIEIRTFPDLELVGDTSLMSILRWSFKNNMEKTMCASDEGQIALVNGCEFASISLLDFENEFSLESLPCLHDEALAAAADVNFTQNQKKTQKAMPGFISNMIKGLKGGEGEQNMNYMESREIMIARLDGMFSRFPFSDAFGSFDKEDLELGIDDIDIDGPVVVSTSQKSGNDIKDKGRERERLFEGGSSDNYPKARTREEIIAKYRNAGDAAASASQAKDKLLERGEKLDRLSKRTAELQSGAENFASMANELAKTMEKRKWWNI
ncbi:hypothetical protein F511_04922 [Dorcoceras hygrometricum]|uniref:V-SNARE coiled-coil homology domain-containing protein n=1 Tax=Dorcoceras hygrometricum TaxID=472368 RepID=A0A2Z7BMX8_9LAMI|nr:hypothetical protein F511_04922 [Dorcoceras hygrometricum]